MFSSSSAAGIGRFCAAAALCTSDSRCVKVADQLLADLQEPVELPPVPTPVSPSPEPQPQPQPGIAI